MSRKGFMDGTIVCFGDSLTAANLQDSRVLAQETVPASFVSRVSRYFSGTKDVLNRGYSGYNSSHAVEQIKLWFPQDENDGPRVDLLTVWFGTNDSSMGIPPNADASRFAQISVERFKENISSIISYVHERSAHTKIVLISCPPCIPEDWQIYFKANFCGNHPDTPQSRTWENTKAYSKAMAEVASTIEDKSKVLVVDTFDALVTSAVEKEFAESVQEVEKDPIKLRPFFVEGKIPDFENHGTEIKVDEHGSTIYKTVPEGLHINSLAYGVIFQQVLESISTAWPNETTTPMLLPDRKSNPTVTPHWSQVDANNPNFSQSEATRLERAAKGVEWRPVDGKSQVEGTE